MSKGESNYDEHREDCKLSAKFNCFLFISVKRGPVQQNILIIQM